MKLQLKLISSVACTLLLFGCAHSSPTAKPSKIEPANISYNFRNMPLDQVLDVYKNLASKNLTVGSQVNHQATLNILTVTKLTHTEAMKLLENAMQQQAHVSIIHKKDGSLMAVPVIPQQNIF